MFPSKWRRVELSMSAPKCCFGFPSAKPGYIMLVDIDPQGKMSQIYPRPELLSRFNKPDMNLVKPGDQILIPS